MPNIKQIKNKLEIRKRLIHRGYQLDYEAAVIKGNDIFNDRHVGETWTSNVKFILKKCDFDWKGVTDDNTQISCKCEVLNKRSKKLYQATIITDSKLKNEIEHRVQKTLGLIEYEGKVICRLLDFQYFLIIIIRPKIRPITLHSEYEEADRERDTFSALTDGQYVDYDDFDGDWDKLDEWRGA